MIDKKKIEKYTLTDYEWEAAGRTLGILVLCILTVCGTLIVGSIAFNAVMWAANGGGCE